MKSLLIRRAMWAVALSTTHLILYQTAGLLPSAASGLIGFLSWAPWLPLAWADIAVATRLIPTPSYLGLLWCAVVWLAIYWLLAGRLAKLAGNSGAARTSRSRRSALG